MFEFVNLIAVFGTTCFMVAVAMIWYSSYLFQKPWMKSVKLTQIDVELNTKRNQILFPVTFLIYFAIVYLLAVTIGYAEVFGLSVQRIALMLSLSFAALSAGFMVWEYRSLSYYLITIGFSSVFILGSTFLLYYWPW